MTETVKDDPRIKRQPLPGVMGSIEQLIGADAAEKFAVRFGGTEVYIPLACDKNHKIAKAIGFENALIVCAHLGGPERDPQDTGVLANGGWAVPTCEVVLKWNVARRLRLCGFSRNMIVTVLRAKYGICSTVPSVGKLISDLPKPADERS